MQKEPLFESCVLSSSLGMRQMAGRACPACEKELSFEVTISRVLMLIMLRISHSLLFLC